MTQQPTDPDPWQEATPQDQPADRAETADPGATRSADLPPSAERDPDEWVTGDQPMTGPQKSYVHTLAHEAGAEVPDDLSKAEASKLIDELQDRTGRGTDSR
jgi:DUF3072 family protein